MPLPFVTRGPRAAPAVAVLSYGGAASKGAMYAP